MTYKKILTEGSTQTPAQQHAAAIGARKPGQKPKPAGPARQGVQPDEARMERERQLQERSAKART
jgi:hypothetical protein